MKNLILISFALLMGCNEIETFGVIDTKEAKIKQEITDGSITDSVKYVKT